MAIHYIFLVWYTTKSWYNRHPYKINILQLNFLWRTPLKKGHLVIQDTWPSPSFIQLFIFLTIILDQRVSVLEKFHCSYTLQNTTVQCTLMSSKDYFTSPKKQAKESNGYPICPMNKSLNCLYIVRIRCVLNTCVCILRWGPTAFQTQVSEGPIRDCCVPSKWNWTTELAF